MITGVRGWARGHTTPELSTSCTLSVVLDAGFLGLKLARMFIHCTNFTWSVLASGILR